MIGRNMRYVYYHMHIHKCIYTNAYMLFICLLNVLLLSVESPSSHNVPPTINNPTVIIGALVNAVPKHISMFL